ncbi:murein L,D-transpeptidase [Rhizobiales bacterium L72]|uniref:Murein L,D-transpeptidase n=1 Tax=Propylenella binzhouense TaxID=2555902 RepID=A0A964T5E6_9HYPH|nr:murein L,D-transpeptidase [Propylenella binzhouense]
MQAAPPATVPPAAPALPTGPALQQQAAPAAPPRLETLAPETVNAATYREHAEQDRGASALILKAQVLLDRANSSPGVIDGIYGDNVAKAIAAYETVLGLPVDGRLDPEVWTALGGDHARPVLVPYTITPEDVAGPFTPSIPGDFAQAAKLDQMGFTGPLEMFGERFHMDVKLLKALNPNADFSRAGETIIVADTQGRGLPGTKVVRIEADKARRQIRAYDDQDWLVVAYPATIGSSDNPSPSGTHTVDAIAPNPVYYYNPKNFLQGSNTKPLQLPPGPNNPVGTMWIDLSEPSYGIHGTPEPSRIDKTNSHGCIRLTNWDAEELSKLVIPKTTTVTFIDPAG